MKLLDHKYKAIKKIYILTNEMWKKEIDSDGASFDYDSQDIYHHQIKVFNDFDFSEKYTDEQINEERKGVMDSILELVEENISIYEENRQFFENLDRERLRMETFRLRYYGHSALSDNELRIKLIGSIELVQRKEYFESAIYNEVGFLSEDFHYRIYHYSITLQNLIKGNLSLKDFDSYKTNVPLDAPISMIIAGYIHREYNNDIFEDISEIDFYREINFMNTVKKLKIKEGKTVQFYYLLSKLSEKSSKIWLKKILFEMRIDEKIYKSKYRQVVGRDATKAQKEFAKEIDKLFLSL